MSERDRDGKTYDGEDLEEAKEPEAFMQDALSITRRCLGLLVSPPKKLITAAEYHELDDQMQQLVLEEMKARFPEFDLESNMVKQTLECSVTLTGEEMRLIDANQQEDENSVELTLASMFGATHQNMTGDVDEAYLDLSKPDRETPGMEILLVNLIDDGFLPILGKFCQAEALGYRG
jgi:hypothetical protein